MLATKPKQRSRNGLKAKQRRSRAPAELRFQYLMLTPDKKGIVCKLDSGKIYELAIATCAVAEAWDGSGVAGVRLEKDRRTAWLKLRSGVELDFPADFVLHHCEPTYAFHVSKIPPSMLGARVKALRERDGLTLEELSAKTGIAISNLSRLEHDKVNPSIKTLARVAKALGVDVAGLVG
ncbi:MAG: helix-turn-helix domain-containing protein [Planctomycetota bacterium]|nr:helix-turn-helix domain-containing protein [Planctomycetota bacterium]